MPLDRALEADVFLAFLAMNLRLASPLGFYDVLAARNGTELFIWICCDLMILHKLDELLV